MEGDSSEGERSTATALVMVGGGCGGERRGSGATATTALP